jgi:glycosyltransferase involved in cell wall biosynthesis
MENRPFVTIGVTTYNRHALLRQNLDSILAQTFGDFEVIVGNDYTADVLTGEILGIDDPRIRIFNHPENLGEIGNMNALLGMARGRYFTWLFDDDLYEPDFLQTAHDCLAEKEFPPAFFSSYRFLRVDEPFEPAQIPKRPVLEFTGREFIRWYSPSRMQIASVLGLFNTDILRNALGGVESLCPTAIGVYSEYLLLVRCALLDRIIYTDRPLVIYRVHPGSWSESPSEMDKYIAAGKVLIRKSSEVLRHPALIDDFNANLIMVCGQHQITVAHRTVRIETAEKKYGPGALLRAIKKYRQEAGEIQRLFQEQGGERNFRTMLAFVKIDAFCYYTILINFASFFYNKNKYL